MTATNTSELDRDRRAAKRRKLGALLAGGLVLGVGAAVTLASWNDSEFAKANLTAGTFVFQGSTDGTTFADHASSGGAASLTFTTGFDKLSPNDVVYAPYALKLTGSSPATLTPTAPAVTGALSGKATFAAVQTATFGCNAGAFTGGTTLVTTMSPGDTVNLCLKVTASPTIAQGDTGAVVWQWDAVSQ